MWGGLNDFIKLVTTPFLEQPGHQHQSGKERWADRIPEAVILIFERLAEPCTAQQERMMRKEAARAQGQQTRGGLGRS